MVMVTPKHVLPDWWYSEGAKIITVEIERFIPLAKSTNYLSAVYALQLAKEQQAIEAVYVDRANRILEGTTTNFFYFKGDTLITPAEGSILPGITRSVILELAKDRFEVQARDIDFSELGGMEEVFITASNKEVVPIIKINDQPIGNGTPGPKTRTIMKLFREYTDAFGQGTV
jgi:branched-chain amino acid aminotransferase